MGTARAPAGSRAIAAGVVVAVVAMVGMAYAAVPLYRLFCAATGYNGTTQVALAAPTLRGARTLRVRFDTNVSSGLPWTFEAERPYVDLQTGVTTTVYFKVRNQTGRPTVATAAFNVSPDAAGAFFNKLSCFCFAETALAPSQAAELPVVFFLDPALEKDDLMRDVSEVTLSYTLFASKGARGAQVAPRTPVPPT